MRESSRVPLLFLALVCAALLHDSAAQVPNASPEQNANAFPTDTIESVAINGEPFGVLSVHIPLPDAMVREMANADDQSTTIRVLVRDTEDRTFYPVVRVETASVPDEEGSSPRLLGRRGRLGGRILNRLREVVRNTGGNKTIPVSVTVSTLYRGGEPVKLVLDGDLQQQLEIIPQGSDPTRHRALLGQWWDEYTSEAQSLVQKNDFPSLVQRYLTSMLSTRFGLPRVDLDADEQDGGANGDLEQPLQTLSLLAAIEPLREQVLEDVLNGPAESEPADQPLPEEPQWQPTRVPEPDPAVEIEDIASRIPPECFYLRFGSFSNFVWMQDLNDRFGGDLAQAVVLRGYSYDAAARIERMLAAKMTQLAKMFGDNLIEDLALVGTDLYVTEGPSLGVIFQARNPGILTTAIRADRQAIAARNPDASVADLEIEGRTVVRMSTPDNRIRSFFVTDGSYVMVTTSRKLVERFLQVGSGAPSLASSAHFRWTRGWMPKSNDYSIFAYFSPEFFQHLVSPQYQIELQRRLAAIAHLEIAELASQLAESEGSDSPQILELKTAGLLPPWFDERVDGASTLRYGDEWIDSRRGARGSFLPIADVEVTGISATEADNYRRLAAYYQNQWRHMDPMVIGIRRFRIDEQPDAERVAFEAYVAPFEAEKYGWVGRLLGSPSPISIQLPADDIASLQVRMKGNSVLNPNGSDYQLFAGIKDMVPPNIDSSNGLLKTLQALKAMPAYVGAWPKPGLVELLPIIGKNLAVADAQGFSRVLGGLWRWQDAEFSLLSFDRSILEDVVSRIVVTESEDFAQARLRVTDLQASQMADWVNQEWYQRAWKSSRANVILLDSIHQQLGVPTDECLRAAERFLDVRMHCPLGGQYKVQPSAGPGSESSGWWTSTALGSAYLDPESGERMAPEEYQAPWIEWFRGCQLHLTQGSQSLSLVGELGLEMPPPSIQVEGEGSIVLPQMNFDLFGLPKQIFGGGEDTAPKRQKF